MTDNDWAYLADYGKKVRCPECSRVFDPMNDTDVNDLEYGHDCEQLEEEV